MGEMLLLVLFAGLAGAGTALTPCVLPVLPALLSASATGGRRRPLGIVLGLVLTHTIAIVALATVIDGVGLADGAVRTLAVVVLVLFGVALMWPALGERVERPLSRLARFGPRSPGDGLLSGLAVGGALGFVYAPCAGPILAAVVSVGATQGATAEIVAVALGYGFGSGVVLLCLALGGRRVIGGLRSVARGPALQRALGAVLVVTGVGMAADLDVRFQTALADQLPAFVTNPTRAIERSDAVEARLANLRGRPRFDSDPDRPAAADVSRRVPASLPVLGSAPDFQDNERWFNTPGGRPLSLKRLRGRVVLVDFWTYTCINCIRTLPYLKAWDSRYRSKGLTIVGVHTPEFAFERKADNVREAIARNGIRYPVAQDNQYGTWTAWGNQFWPAKYLIDASGKVRYTHFGEGSYRQTEQAIRTLLGAERRRPLGSLARARGEIADPGVRTPETYLGAERAQAFLPGPPMEGLAHYPGVRDLPADHFALRGAWRVSRESATAVGGASLDARFVSRKVFLVLRSPGRRARKVRVLLDGRPLMAREAGEDVVKGEVTVRGERLYRLVSLPSAQERRLTLRFDPGVTGYAFTFG
jgi:cytochrome c biogenesis protein CcdA/thiol-disulfide isomerase/thioredoxin